MKFAYNLRQIQIQRRRMQERERREQTGRQTNKFSTPLAAAAAATTT